MKKLIIIGAGGHGKVIADIAKKNGYEQISFLDDNDTCKKCGLYDVIGKIKDYSLYRDCDFIVGIGNSKLREKFQNGLLENDCKVITLIHPSAIIAEDVTIGIGTVVMANAVINPGTIIENGVIINTCSSVDHDCMIGDFAHISVGTHLAGTVDVGSYTMIGAGSVISNNLSICSNCMLGAGSVVIRDINERGTYVGVPCIKLKK